MTLTDKEIEDLRSAHENTINVGDVILSANESYLNVCPPSSDRFRKMWTDLIREAIREELKTISVCHGRYHE